MPLIRLNTFSLTKMTEQFDSPEIRPVWTSDPGTMAFTTARTRWPGIIANMVEDVEESMADGSKDQEEGRIIITRLKELQRDIESNELLQ